MNATKIDSLGTMAAEFAMRGAAEFLRANPAKQGKLTDAELDQLLALIRQYAKAAVLAALDDAGAALAAGMDMIAEQTFKATMAIAGVQAAKTFNIWLAVKVAEVTRG